MECEGSERAVKTGMVRHFVNDIDVITVCCHC